MNCRACLQSDPRLAVLMLAIVAGGLICPPPAPAQTNYSLTDSLGLACRSQEKGQGGPPRQTAPLIGNIAVSDGRFGNSSATYGTSNSYGALNLTAACAAGPGAAGYESGASFGSDTIFFLP